MEHRGVSDGYSSDVSDFSEHPSTTTISTVAVQAGNAKIVLAILRSNEWIRVRIQQMEPDLMDVGSTLEEARALRKQHDELLRKLNLKQKDVTELLARADDLASQSKSYQEVYAAMAESLGEAWKDLNAQLEFRKMLLDQSIAFHESASSFSVRMETAQGKFASVGLAQDVETARRLLQQHQDMKKGILEASMSTLQEGQSLLDRIREMGMHADVQNRHATTAACYGIESLLELLHDRRRHLEELWLNRKIKLEQCLQLLLLDAEANKVLEWYANAGDAYLSKKDLGENLPTAQQLQLEHMSFELHAKEIQETVLRLVRTADQLVHSAHYDAEGVKQRLKTVDGKCENFMVRLDSRRKNVSLATSFFSQAQTALLRLDEIEVELNTSDLPRNSAALAERHAYLSNAIVEASAPALREGRILLERVGREDPGVQGVSNMVTALQERCTKLENMCKTRYEAGERSQAAQEFQEKYAQVSSWFGQIGQATLSLHRDMGADLFTARDFLEIHERLDGDMKDKRGDLEALTKLAANLAQSGDQEGAAAQDKVKVLREQWDLLVKLIQKRIKLAVSYVTFHKKSQSLALQLDALEQYLKIEKIDPAEIKDSSIKHKEEKWGNMSRTFSQVEGHGKLFIKEANDVKEDEKLDTRRAITVVETTLQLFTERKLLMTDYYEHWKVHVNTGKEFKTQWHQFVQDARKTIDWIMKVEKELFMPYIAGHLGKSMAHVKSYQEKLDKFAPTVKKAQSDIEEHLKTAEMLSLKGDTRGGKEQIVNELLKVHTRFQSRVNEYQVLISMTSRFFKNLSQLDKLIEDTAKEYKDAELPKEVSKAELLLQGHESNRDKIKQLIGFSTEEGEQIVVRVRQQDSEAIAKDEVQKVLQMTEERRKAWEKSWEDQRLRLEQNLQICQFYFDLRGIHKELDELHHQLRARHGNYGSSLASVKMTSNAFRQFENSVQPIEKKIQNFVSTAEMMIREQHYDSRRIRHEVEQVQRKWTEFYTSIGEYRTSLDGSTKYFEGLHKAEEWIDTSSQMLLNVGKKATECKTSDDVLGLIKQIDEYRAEGAPKQDDRLNDMERVTVTLYGQVQGPQKMEHVVEKNRDLMDSFVKAIQELAILRDNLLKKEHILAEMDRVVEAKKVPSGPRFITPLSNAEITEGQKFTFECRLACETQPKIEWYKDSIPLASPDYETTYTEGTAKLTIEETFSEDSAKYTCRAVAPEGTAETSATLRVKETHQKIVPPDFSKNLKSQDVPGGTQLVLECHVSGIPAPSISWLKDDQSIDASPEYVITKKKKVPTATLR